MAISALALGLAGMGIGSALGSSAVSQIEGKRTRRFQERLSSTAHQREIRDLKKAGLNPLLTGKYGGSSTPAGAPAPSKAIEGAVSSAVQYQSVKNQSKLIDAQIMASITQAELNRANSAKAITEAEKIRTDTFKSRTETGAIIKRLGPEIRKIEQDIKTSTSLSKKQKTDRLRTLQLIKRDKFIGDIFKEGSDIKKDIDTLIELPGKSYKAKKEQFKKIRNQLHKKYRK